MTIDEIKRRKAKIKEWMDTPIMSNGMESALYYDFIQWLANEEKELHIATAQELAAEILIPDGGD